MWRDYAHSLRFQATLALSRHVGIFKSILVVDISSSHAALSLEVIGGTILSPRVRVV